VTTGLKVVEIARKELGTKEQPQGSNKQKYGLYFAQNGAQWCAFFVSWCIVQSGLKLPRIGIGYCPDWVNWFKKIKRFYPNTSKPQVGDIVFFAFRSDWYQKGIAQHIGIVESINKDGSINTIEGNTSSGLVGSQDNGDGVYRRKRNINTIVGYGRPIYE